MFFFFQWCYYERNFKYRIFYFQVYDNLVEKNRMYQHLRGITSGVASPKIWGINKFRGGKVFDFRRITLFC